MNTTTLLDLLRQTEQTDQISIPSKKARALIIEVLEVRNDAVVHKTAFAAHQLARREVSQANKDWHDAYPGVTQTAEEFAALKARDAAPPATFQDIVKDCVAKGQTPPTYIQAVADLPVEKRGPERYPDGPAMDQATKFAKEMKQKVDADNAVAKIQEALGCSMDKAKAIWEAN